MNSPLNFIIDKEFAPHQVESRLEKKGDVHPFFGAKIGSDQDGILVFASDSDDCTKIRWNKVAQCVLAIRLMAEGLCNDNMSDVATDVIDQISKRGWDVAPLISLAGEQSMHSEEFTSLVNGIQKEALCILGKLTPNCRVKRLREKITDVSTRPLCAGKTWNTVLVL